jgi:ribosomal protein S25
MLHWHKKLKFRGNPLDARPNPNLVGLDEEEEQLKNHIVKEEICFLNGLTGSGKTSLLHKMQKELKGYSFIYLDAQDLPPDFNLEQAISNKKSFFDMISLRRFPKNKPVLIIDEFQATDPRLILEARGKWENRGDNKIKSIVIAQINRQLKNVSDSFKDRLGNRIITLKTLDEEEMKEILKRRLQNKKTGINYLTRLSEDALNLLIKCADGNARRLLEYTDMIFDFHHRRFKDINPIDRDNYFISYYAAKEILEQNKINVRAFEKQADEISSFSSKQFSELQERLLRFLIDYDRVTVDTVAKTLKISVSTARRSISSLKKKKAILIAGKKNRKELLVISPSVKRVLTEE